MKRLAAILALGLLTSMPAAADEFCDTLLRVMDDAGHSFEHIRGPQTFPDVVRYDHVPSLPGALSFDPQYSPCAIYSSGPTVNPLRYACEFPSADGYHAVSNRVTACLTSARRHIQTQQAQGTEQFRISATTAIVVMDIDRPGDGSGMKYALFIDPL